MFAAKILWVFCFMLVFLSTIICGGLNASFWKNNVKHAELQPPNGRVQSQPHRRLYGLRAQNMCTIINKQGKQLEYKYNLGSDCLCIFSSLAIYTIAEELRRNNK